MRYDAAAAVAAMANEVVAALVSMPANMMPIGLDTVDCGKRKGRKNWSGEMRGGLDEDSLFIIIVMLLHAFPYY